MRWKRPYVWFAGLMLCAADSHTGSSLVVVDVEPEIVADLVRHQLAARGVTAVGAAEATRRADVALVAGPLPEGVEADVVVRLPGAGERLPAVARVEAAGSEGACDVAVSSLDALIDLLVDLASGES